MIMWRRRGARVYQTQRARHPEVDELGSVVKTQQKILATPTSLEHGSPYSGSLYFLGHRPSQAGVAYFQPLQASPLYVRGDATSGNFDFREFWHKAC